MESEHTREIQDNADSRKRQLADNFAQEEKPGQCLSGPTKKHEEGSELAVSSSSSGFLTVYGISPPLPSQSTKRNRISSDDSYYPVHLLNNQDDLFTNPFYLELARVEAQQAKARRKAAKARRHRRAAMAGKGEPLSASNNLNSVCEQRPIQEAPPVGDHQGLPQTEPASDLEATMRNEG